MKKVLFMALTLLVVVAVDAKKLELKEITRGMFRGETVSDVQPLNDGETYAQLSNDGRRIVQYSFKTGKEVATLFDVATVKGDKLDNIDGYIMSPDGKRILIQTKTQRIYRHSFTAQYYIYTIRNNRIVPLSKNGPQQTPLFSPDGVQIAFVRDGNIFIVKLLYDNAEMQVTKDGKKNQVINGIPDWVNEEEFSQNRAMVFSADSRQIVWVRYDESAVNECFIPMTKGGYSYKYPVAGEQNSTVSVWSYDVPSRQTRQLQVPIEKDGYVSRLVATADSSKVAVFTLNRHQDCLRIYMANPLTTVSKLAVEDKVNKYVREETYGKAIISSRHILLPSDRDGNMHLYLYNFNGQLLRQVEQGNYEVSDVYGYDEKTGAVYYASHENGATDQRVWVAYENGKRECLTKTAGWNSAVFSKNYQYFINTWSDINTPSVCAIHTNKGKKVETLVDNKTLSDQLKNYQLGTRELFTLTTSEGVTLNGWMVKPADFTPQKQYPVVMYQYGGPGSQSVKNTWNVGMAGQGAALEQYLCQQGFICVCIDNRGTGGRGADFEKCTYLKLGQLEAADQVEAALWLGQQSYVDKKHIAIWGWSFGGFNTLMSMSEGRGVFCAGIAIAPPTTWRYYDTIYTERYMRTPQENPSGYDDNPLTRVNSLQGALMIVHGLADDNVHYRNTAEYCEALIQADKDFRQQIYADRNHSIYGGNTRNHLFRQCVNFLKENMK
jgi:dipeptidyl-peptidase-4